MAGGDLVPELHTLYFIVSILTSFMVSLVWIAFQSKEHKWSIIYLIIFLGIMSYLSLWFLYSKGPLGKIMNIGHNIVERLGGTLTFIIFVWVIGAAIYILFRLVEK